MSEKIFEKPKLRKNPYTVYDLDMHEEDESSPNVEECKEDRKLALIQTALSSKITRFSADGALFPDRSFPWDRGERCRRNHEEVLDPRTDPPRAQDLHSL